MPSFLFLPAMWPFVKAIKFICQSCINPSYNYKYELSSSSFLQSSLSHVNSNMRYVTKFYILANPTQPRLGTSLIHSWSPYRYLCPHQRISPRRVTSSTLSEVSLGPEGHALLFSSSTELPLARSIKIESKHLVDLSEPSGNHSFFNHVPLTLGIFG